MKPKLHKQASYWPDTLSWAILTAGRWDHKIQSITKQTSQRVFTNFQCHPNKVEDVFLNLYIFRYLSNLKWNTLRSSWMKSGFPLRDKLVSKNDSSIKLSFSYFHHSVLYLLSKRLSNNNLVLLNVIFIYPCKVNWVRFAKSKEKLADSLFKIFRKKQLLF